MRSITVPVSTSFAWTISRPLAGAMELKLDLHGVDGQLGELSIEDLMMMDVIPTPGNASLRRSADGVEIEWP